MPSIDHRSGDVVLRIVFDGPPEAGKTSTIDHLASLISLQRRSPLARPGTTERRTEFFDWLDFAGGFLDGRRVRCQLVSVPGQSSLLHRRRYLLERADVIVFVADATRQDYSELREAFGTTLSILEKCQGEVPVGVLLQANKQDLAGAVGATELAAALGLEASVPAIRTSASSGVGIMQTLILAVRLATERARTLLIGDLAAEPNEMASSPEQLYGAMLELEPPASSVSVEPVRAAPLEQHRESTLSRLRRMLELPLRPNPAVPEGATPPQATLLPAGCIWPSVTGRAALAAANQSRLLVPANVADFAPDSGFELEAEGGWVFHSCERWRFEREAEARWSLLSLARSSDPNALPEGRAMLVAAENGAWRLWMLTRRPQTLLEQLAQALDGADAAALLQLWAALRDAAQPGTALLSTPSALVRFAVQRGRLVKLPVPDEAPVATTGVTWESPLVQLERALVLVAATSSDHARTVLAARTLLTGNGKRSMA